MTNHHSIKDAIDGRLAGLTVDDALRDRIVCEDTKPRRVYLKPAYVLLIALISALLVGATYVIAQTQMLNIKTGEITPHPDIVSKETQQEEREAAVMLQKVADEIEPKIPQGQYAVVSVKIPFETTNESGQVISSGVSGSSLMVRGPESDGDGFVDNGILYEESVFKQKCKGADIDFPVLSDYGDLTYAYAHISTDEEDQIAKPLKTETYDGGITVEYYSMNPVLPEVPEGSQYYSAYAIYHSPAMQEDLCVQMTLRSGSEESAVGFSDGAQVTRAEVAGWDTVVCLADSEAFHQNNIFLTRALDNGMDLSVMLQSQTLPIQTLLELAEKME